jgi:hypothetical protein
VRTRQIGRFELVERIGSGGMAEVYPHATAEDADGRTYAMIRKPQLAPRPIAIGARA